MNMDISKERSLESLKYLEIRLRTDCEKMSDILKILTAAWNDPGAELIRTELKKQISSMEELTQKLRNRILLMECSINEEGE